MSSFDDDDSREIPLHDGEDVPPVENRALLINAPGHCEPDEPATLIHGWQLLRSDRNPCGCFHYAKALLSDVRGDSGMVAERAGDSNCTMLHRFECARCKEALIVVQNQSGRKRWVASAFQVEFGLLWSEVPIPADIVCVLGLEPSAVHITPSAETGARLCDTAGDPSEPGDLPF